MGRQLLDRPFPTGLRLDGPRWVDDRGVRDRVPIFPALLDEGVEGVTDEKKRDKDLWLASLEVKDPRPCEHSKGPAILRALAAVT